MVWWLWFLEEFLEFLSFFRMSTWELGS
jgi:hypothetical protein